MLSMADPYAKLGWAKNHLDALDPEICAFCTPAQAYAVTRHDDVENERHIIRTELRNIPPRVCLIAGDAVYNMRAALDQTVWALAALSGPPGLTRFPIVEVWNTDTPKRFAKQIVGVPDEAFCEIQALQPYHRGDAFKSHPLWRLDEMCNLDKHRRLASNSITVDGTIYGIPLHSMKDVIFQVTDECHIISVPLALKEQVDLDPNPPIEITFGGDLSGITETFPTLIEIYNFVAKDVLPRFDRFFA